MTGSTIKRIVDAFDKRDSSDSEFQSEALAIVSSSSELERKIERLAGLAHDWIEGGSYEAKTALLISLIEKHIDSDFRKTSKAYPYLLEFILHKSQYLNPPELEVVLDLLTEAAEGNIYFEDHSLYVMRGGGGHRQVHDRIIQLYKDKRTSLALEQEIRKRSQYRTN